MALTNNEYMIRQIVNTMMGNSQSWSSADEEERERLAQENENLVKKLKDDYDITATKKNGNWYLPDGTRLYEKYGTVNNEGLSAGNLASVNFWVSEMKTNGREYLSADEERRQELSAENERIVAEELSRYDINPAKTDGGVWKLPDDRKLYDVFGNNSPDLDPSVNGVNISSPFYNDEGETYFKFNATHWGESSIDSSVRPAGTWGKLPGYSWDTIGSPDGGLANESWRKATEYAKTWMNDGVPSSDEQTRRLIHWQKFDRFYTPDLEHENPSGRHYIFILRPDLYLIKDGSASENVIQLADESNVAHDPYFTYLAKMHPEIIASLTGDFAGMAGASLSNTQYGAATGSGYGNSATTDGTTINGQQLTIHTFIPYLSSRVESLQLPDYTVKSSLLTQPYTKYSIPYTQSAIESSTGGTCDITFREDKDYSIHKLFYAWVYYENNVMKNIFKPKKKYLQYNSIDYATSIYDFLVDDTGENIIYWSKYTGCVPTSVPMSDLGFNRGGAAETKVTISFSYFYCEHMDMNILRDFQYNSLGHIFMGSIKDHQFQPCGYSDTEPLYNANDRLGPNLTGRPVIMLATGASGDRKIKLRWLKDAATTKTAGRAAQ